MSTKRLIKYFANISNMQITSQQGKGTTVTLHLQQLFEGRKRGGRSMKTLKVMIVDDHIQIVEGLAARIDWQQLGSPVVFQYTDPLTALKKAQEETVDLVLSDICIPGMSGLEMSKRLLHINPRTKIIFISGYADYEYAVEAVHMHTVERCVKNRWTLKS